MIDHYYRGKDEEVACRVLSVISLQRSSHGQFALDGTHKHADARTGRKEMKCGPLASINYNPPPITLNK